jgi:hypothetical protein
MMTQISLIDNHSERVLESLISFFSNAENLKKVVQIVTEETQEAEQVWYDLWDLSFLATAQGEQLDQWGVIVGQSRLFSWSDDEYRKAIETKILANKSTGTPEEIIEIARRVLDPLPWYQWGGQAHYVIVWFISTLYSADWTDYVEDLLLQATPAGVSFSVTGAPFTGAYRLDSGPGLDVGKLAGTII